MSDTEAAIVHELCVAIERQASVMVPDQAILWIIDTLRGMVPPVELASIIGSYGDTLSDAEILNLLREYNRTGKVMHERQ